MSHTLTDKGNQPSQDDTKKKRNKQAKREAKMMLKVEQIRQDVQKAEKKVAKAQSQLEDYQAQLQDLETKLVQMRAQTSQSVTAAASDQLEDSGTQEVQAEQEASTPTDQVATLPPAEGRADLLEEQGAAHSEQSAAVTEPVAFQLPQEQSTVQGEAQEPAAASNGELHSVTYLAAQEESETSPDEEESRSSVTANEEQVDPTLNAKGDEAEGNADPAEPAPGNGEKPTRRRTRRTGHTQ
ncbi:MAG TPA: hypothetical protein VKR06_40670 [Ktedonosporobacter sp.]|nr:hypothetical protein [Ktedonosporobacter sp.]